MGLFNKIIEGIKGLFGIKSKNQPKQLDAPRTRNSASISEFKQQEESYNNEKQENDLNSVYEDFVENNLNQTESEEWKKELEEDLRKLKYEEDRVVHSEQELVEDMDKQLEGLDEKNKKEQNRKLLIQAYARGKLEEQLEESKRDREDEEERLSEEQLDEFLKNIGKMDDEAVLESKAKKIEEEKDKEELEKELAKQKKEYNNVETEVWKYKLGKDLREMDDDSVKEKENPFER